MRTKTSNEAKWIFLRIKTSKTFEWSSSLFWHGFCCRKYLLVDFQFTLRLMYNHLTNNVIKTTLINIPCMKTIDNYGKYIARWGRTNRVFRSIPHYFLKTDIWHFENYRIHFLVLWKMKNTKNSIQNFYTFGRIQFGKTQFNNFPNARCWEVCKPTAKSPMSSSTVPSNNYSHIFWLEN